MPVRECANRDNTVGLVRRRPAREAANPTSRFITLASDLVRTPSTVQNPGSLTRV